MLYKYGNHTFRRYMKKIVVVICALMCLNLNAKQTIKYKAGILCINDIEYPMVNVDGGRFYMGASLIQEDIFDNQDTVHIVSVNNFRIGKFEVTQEMWEAVMGSNPSNFKGPKRPVDSVSWNDCLSFISKLNELTGKKFRLPTEAEWEFAAMGGKKSKGYKYSGSNNPDEVAWHKNNSEYLTHDVGTKLPNELGLFDMSGNVHEWCSDWYGNYTSCSQINPKGPSDGSYKVIRGGSWLYDILAANVSYRFLNPPTSRFGCFGFRLCL